MLNGDSQSEPYLWEKGASGTFVTGARHASAESEFEYGSRVGCWRLLRLFREMGWRFTSWACGQALEGNPSFAAAMVRDGHEVAAHGQRWLEIWEYGLEEERAYIRANCESIKKMTGRFPRGVFFGRGTPNTKALFPEVLRGLGTELLYSSETAFNDDVPYWIDLPAEKDLPDTEKKGLLIVPYNYDCNGTFSPPSSLIWVSSTNGWPRWQIPHVARLRGLDDVSRVPEEHLRHAVPRRLQRQPPAHEHPDARADCR